MPLKLLFVICLILSSCKKESPPTSQTPWNDQPAFWVWNQTTPPPSSSDHTLYIQVAEFTAETHRVLQQEPPASGDVAVVRLPPGRDSLTDPEFQKRLFDYLGENSFPRLQLDYDCAAMNLRLYRTFLESLRSKLKPDHLSITALASWIDAPDFEKLARSVDELTPMFYDLEADQASQIKDLSPRPLIDQTTLSWIKKWQKCPTTWQAGLPNFQRLSLFQKSGELIGHLQRWSPSDLSQLSALTPVSPPSRHSLVYRIDRSQIYQNIALEKGHFLIWRSPDESLTRQAITTAKDAGASSIIWFAHPDSAPVAWHSVSHLSGLTKNQSPQPDLQTTFQPDGSVTLTNKGLGDLPFAPQQEPWQLVLESESLGTFSSTQPGQFAKITAPGSSLVRPQLARTIALSFPHLRSGQSLTSSTGLITSPQGSAPSTRITPKQP